jgi:signal peptidase I
MRRQRIALQVLRDYLISGDVLNFAVISNSMAPLIREGDTIQVINNKTGSLKVGDVVVFIRNNELITHRLIKIKNEYYYTKGDQIITIDPPVKKKDFLGLVVSVCWRDRQLNLMSKQWILANRIIGILGWVQLLILNRGAHIKKEKIVTQFESYLTFPFRLISRGINFIMLNSSYSKSASGKIE